MTTGITTAALVVRTAAPRSDSMWQGRSQSGWAQMPESATP